MDAVAVCQHRFFFDPENEEMICEKGCGWAVPRFENKALAQAPKGARLSSPSVAGNGLGTDLDQSIVDLRRGRARRDEEDEESDGSDTMPGRTYLLSGALKRFYARDRTDEDLVMELTNRLHGKVSDDHLALIAQLFRREIGAVRQRGRAELLKVLDAVTGDKDGH